MPKKVNLDGETYIVSEDVDFEQLDTENMVEKNQQVELIVKSPYANLLSNQLTKNEKKSDQTQSRLRPTITFVLKFAKRVYYFKGDYRRSEVIEHTSCYKLMMRFTEAMKLQQIMLKAQARSGVQGKRILLLKSIIEWNNGEKFEHVPPKGSKGITSQKLERVKISPMCSKRHKDIAYVEIVFGSIHW